MKKIFLYILVTAFAFTKIKAQGCVAIRGTGMSNCMHHADSSDNKGWSLNVNYRYFKSFRHFVGTTEQKQRIAQGSEVINYTNTIDISVTKNINRFWSFALDVPVLSNARSSLYEHGGKSRHSTHSFGLGDIRFTAYRWLIDPAKAVKGNIQAGLGLKLPTGDYKYQDFFYVNDSTSTLGPVDQSIQLGDGGLGFSTELNGYYNFSYRLSAYGNFYYLFNPREQNGTSTARGSAPSAASIRYGSSTMSVPDQLLLRAGASYRLGKLNATAGIRYERLPAHDLIGGSSGFRRPGWILSAEPGLSYQFKKFSAYAAVPVALKRSRIQSVPDIVRTRITGVYAQGDAAFSDYSINVGFTYRF
ncbi:MAG: hypothetical protein EKK37_09010 [Sphingobacteriales bacterium]|nr:MAG: hypothetical protein EKK37_09010 [Sphingobacteriales bacterium]